MMTMLAMIENHTPKTMIVNCMGCLSRYVRSYKSSTRKLFGRNGLMR